MRRHAPSPPLVLGGLMIHSGFSLATVKLAAILFFLMVTSPTSTHALAKSALSHGIRPWLPGEKDRSNS